MRRQFFSGFAASMAALMALAPGCSLRNGSAEGKLGDDAGLVRVAAPPLPEDLRFLASQYGLRIRLFRSATPPDTIPPVATSPTPPSAAPPTEPPATEAAECVYEPASAAELAAGAPLVCEELRRYERATVDRLWLTELVLCGRITSEGSDVRGLAVGDWFGRIHFSLRIDPRQPAFAANWARHALHHELYHRLDARNGDRFDAQWEALNPASFRYGQKVAEPSTGRPPPKGFLFADAVSSRAEDQAHFFGAMVTHYAAVRDLARRDPIVKAKADLMEEIARSFDRRLGAAFWADALRRSEAPQQRTLAALWYTWSPVTAGADPLAIEAGPATPRVIVRPSTFPDVFTYRREAGRLTQLNIPRERLLSRFYGVPVARCVVPPELQAQRFDVIVSMPASSSEEQIWAAARGAFESQFHLTARRETRAVNAYVMRLGAEGTRRLEALSQEANRPRSAPPFAESRPQDDAARMPRRSTPEWRSGRGPGGPYGFGRPATLDELAARFEYGLLDRPLINETGYTRPVRVDLRWDWSQQTLPIARLAEALGVEIHIEPRSLPVVVLETR